MKQIGYSKATWEHHNPVLPARTLGLETNTGKMKVGNGVTAWLDLAYMTGEGLSEINIVEGLVATSTTDLLKTGIISTDVMFPNPTGTPIEGHGFVIELIDDNISSRNISWGSDYDNGFESLPSSTKQGKLGQIAIVYRDGKYRCDGVRWMV